MKITPEIENNLMIARLLGIDEDLAAARLAQSVTLTAHGDEARQFAIELGQQLERTIRLVTDGEAADLEISIDGPSRGIGKKVIFVLLEAERVTISRSQMPGGGAKIHGIQRMVAACYAASVALGELIQDLKEAFPTDPFVVHFNSLGLNSSVLARPIELKDTVLVGAGAVGNAFLRATRHLNISGELTVCDPKNVGSGNPNRCLYFTGDDVGKSKSERLCANGQVDFPNLTLTPFVGTFGDLRKQRKRIRRAIVGADSRPVRRGIEKELPLEIVDASTTGVAEVIVFSHGYPNDGACLACIYPHIPDELGRARDIASGLGLPLEVVVAGGLITESIAEQIISQHPGIPVSGIVGKAFDSLFRELCAQQTLLSPAGEQVLAPFAFVSNLAGALAALELARFESGARFSDGKNYLFASPWAPPHVHLRRSRPKFAECEVCSNANYLLALKAVWPEIV